MSDQDIDLTADATQVSASISWHQPHPIFAIVLVGAEEIPFGIQKDLLCAQSPYYREEFAKTAQGDQLENIVKLPDTDVATFGCFQNFLYTGAVYDKPNGVAIPDYTLLMGIWKLATKLKMASLRLAILDVMAERRQQTNCIPGTSLLIQAWEQTESGSGLRKMLIGWAAEHMRSEPQSRNEFVNALPKQILGELVIAMSDLDYSRIYSAPAAPPPAAATVVSGFAPSSHIYLSPYVSNEPPRSAVKRQRKSEGVINLGGDDIYESKTIIKKQARRSEPGARKHRRISTQGTAGNPIPLSADSELNFCRDLITRMLSGPGYWTRLVGPFRNAVDPVADNVPNYFDVVKRPMDLTTVKLKMSRSEYATAAEFEADIRQIFQNCYEYWTENDAIFKQCEGLEKYFNEKWNERHKWSAPTIKAEAIE